VRSAQYAARLVAALSATFSVGQCHDFQCADQTTDFVISISTTLPADQFALTRLILLAQFVQFVCYGLTGIRQIHLSAVLLHSHNQIH
jgi:hypothetical protein